MTLELATAVSVQQDLAGNTTATLTWGSTAYPEGQLLIVDTMGNWDSGNPTIANQVIPSGGGTWLPVVRQLGTISGGGTATSAWYYIVPLGGQTFIITQTTTLGPGTTNVSSRGVLRRWNGADRTTPIGATDTYVSATTDPLVSAANLELANVRRGSRVVASGCDWTDSAACTVAFDNSVADTEDINTRETGQVRFVSTMSSLTIPNPITALRAGFDVTGGNGNWSAIIYEIRAAASPPNWRRSNALQMR